jgi:hypothetical protein
MGVRKNPRASKESPASIPNRQIHPFSLARRGHMAGFNPAIGGQSPGESPAWEGRVKPASSVLRDVPPERYRLPDDGRQWKHVCVQRQRLAFFLSTYADPDGTSVMPGVESRMCPHMGLKRRAVQYLLDDLKALGFLVDCGKSRFQGTMDRKLLLGAIVQSSDSVQSSEVSMVQSSAPTVQATAPNVHSTPANSAIEECAQPPGSNHQNKPPALPPEEKIVEKEGGWGWLFSSSSTIADMGAANKYFGKLQELGNSETVWLAVRNFRTKRPQGLDKLKHPWIMFLKEADTWMAMASEEVKKRERDKAEMKEAEQSVQETARIMFQRKSAAEEEEEASWEASEEQGIGQTYAAYLKTPKVQAMLAATENFFDTWWPQFLQTSKGRAYQRHLETARARLARKP